MVELRVSVFLHRILNSISLSAKTKVKVFSKPDPDESLSNNSTWMAPNSSFISTNIKYLSSAPGHAEKSGSVILFICGYLKQLGNRLHLEIILSK